MSNPDVPNQILKSIYQATPEFLSQLKLWIEGAGIAVPVNQLVGFTQFTAQQAEVNTQETTTTINTYVDLATVGPQFTSLPNGSYLGLFGCLFAAGGGGGDTGKMALSVDGATPSDSEACWTPANSTDPAIAGARAATFILTNADKHTVKAQYKCAVSGSGWFNRWLVVIRYA